MKKIQFFIYLFSLSSFHYLFAQEELGTGLLFSQFEKGNVIMKTGEQLSGSFNYDMILGQMLFLDSDSTIMKIGNPLDVVVVKIGERRFLPASSTGVFYEEIQAGEGSFFVQRTAFKMSEGKAAAYGGYSQTQSSTSFGSWQSDGGSTAKLNSSDKFKMVTKSVYYLQSGNKYKKFYSAKTLGKLFKGHESEIETFSEKESINFSKTEDIARIVEYGYSLK